jgi:hypothetical protein
MSHSRKHHEFVSAIALLVAWTVSSACTTWHTTSLVPRRFSADTSPKQARLTLSDGTQLTARHPVLVGDSLVWVPGPGQAPRDSARSAVLVSNIRKVEVHEVNAVLTIIGLVVVVGGVVVYTALHALSDPLY